MKIKSEWIEYIIIPSVNKYTKKPCLILQWRTNRLKEMQNWYGIITEEELKKILSRKQFNEWKAGKRNSFIKHLTIQKQKSILKNNNIKK